MLKAFIFITAVTVFKAWTSDPLWIGGELVSGLQFRWVGLTNELISSDEADWDAGQPGGNENGMALLTGGWHDAPKVSSYHALCEGR